MVIRRNLAALIWIALLILVEGYDDPLRTSAHKDAGRSQTAISPPRGFEPLCESAQVAIRQALTESGESVLAFCLALLCAEPGSAGADLPAVVSAWPGLPETVRARILGLVEGATAAGSGG